MNDKNSYIAVVTPVYNREETLEKSILSLIDQTFKNWVNIIVNDGSTDNTAEILKKYNDDSRFIIIHFPVNRGRPYARQAALDKIIEIGAKYMCMLDADDIYYPDKLLWQFNFMEENPEIALMSSSIGYIDKKINLTGVLEPFKERILLKFCEAKKYISVPHASSIIRVNRIDVDYDPNLKLGEDQDFMMRLLINKKYVFIPKISYLYNRELSFSYKKYKESKKIAFYIRNNLRYSKLELLKLSVRDIFKLFCVRVLILIGMKHEYFNKIGRVPTNEEISVHMKSIDNM